MTYPPYHHSRIQDEMKDYAATMEQGASSQMGKKVLILAFPRKNYGNTIICYGYFVHCQSSFRCRWRCSEISKTLRKPILCTIFAKRTKCPTKSICSRVPSIAYIPCWGAVRVYRMEVKEEMTRTILTPATQHPGNRKIDPHLWHQLHQCPI